MVEGRERLGGHLELAPGALLPSADHAPGGTWARGPRNDSRLRADGGAARAPSHSAHHRGAAPRGRASARERTGDGGTPASTPTSCEEPRVRHRALARLTRAAARRALARHPICVRLRLRVRPRPAQPRLSSRRTSRRSRHDPTAAARPARSIGCEGASISGAEGGVLPLRVRAGSIGPGRARPRSGTRARASSGHRRRCLSTIGTETPCSRTCSSGSAGIQRVQAVVLPRTAEQRQAIAALGLPSLVLPEDAVDAQSLVALSDLVVSAGGTMNREAVALGVPVYTTFAGQLGAVDEASRFCGAARRRRRCADRRRTSPAAAPGGSSGSRSGQPTAGGARDPRCCSI